jgi:hypothetical protein
VDLALELYLGTLLALQAARDPAHKRPVAEVFLDQARHRVRELAAAVAAGSRVMLEKHRAIIG